MSRRINDIARIALTDKTVIVTGIDAALTALELGAAGYPTSTPGASPLTAQGAIECPRPDCNESRPCPTHDLDLDAPTFGPVATEWGHTPADKTTPTERLATTPDKALADLDALKEHVRKAAHHDREAAAIVSRWAHGGITDTDIKTRLVAIDAEIWCTNCSRFGRHEPRAKDRTECEWCSAFRQQRKRGAPKEIWDARDARGGKIDETTINRILKQLDTDRKATSAAARTRQRAEGKAS